MEFKIIEVIFESIIIVELKQNHRKHIKILYKTMRRYLASEIEYSLNLIGLHIKM